MGGFPHICQTPEEAFLCSDGKAWRRTQELLVSMGDGDAFSDKGRYSARLLTKQNRTDPLSPHFGLEPAMPIMTKVCLFCHITVKKFTNRDTQRGLSLLSLMK